MRSHQITAAHPAPLVHNEMLAECINACYDCAHACMSCADACLAEDDVGSLRRCIQADWHCADECIATSRMLARQTQANLGLLAAQLNHCRDICQVCAKECEYYRDSYRHCAICAETCHACAERCRELLKAMNVQPQN